MHMEAQETLIQYVKENQNKLYKLAYSYSNNQDSALDILQEAITKALENINKLKNPEYVTTWFYRILINESLLYIRKNKKIIQYTLIDEEKPFENYEDILIENLDIYHLIQNLKPKIKTVIMLRYFENFKIEEIAQILNVNTNTVKSRLYKGLRELKESMERREKNG